MNRELYPESPILIVDDDKDFLKSIDFTLLSNQITNFECCSDSRCVMNLLESKSYSLILLDLLMNHISGEELLPKILEKYPTLPVVVLTAHTEIETAFVSMRLGAIDYLVKPFDNTRFINTIRDNLDFISSEMGSEIFKKFDMTKNGYSSDYSKVLLKIHYILRLGKTELVISKITPLIGEKQITENNVGLFSVLGQAYEKAENFEKAGDIYCEIKKINPHYPGIQQKIQKIDKLKKNSKT